MEQVDFINYVFGNQTSPENLGLTILFNINDANDPQITTAVSIKQNNFTYLYQLDTTSVTSAELRALADKIDASTVVLTNKIAANAAAEAAAETTTDTSSTS